MGSVWVNTARYCIASGGVFDAGSRGRRNDLLLVVPCCGLGFSGRGLSLPFILAISGSGFLKFAGPCLL